MPREPHSNSQSLTHALTQAHAQTPNPDGAHRVAVQPGLSRTREGAREAQNETASPYVSLYIPRTQALEIRRVVLWHATGTAKSNKLWAALKNIDKALGGDDA